MAPVPKADDSKVPPVAEHPDLATRRAAVASPGPDSNRRWSFFPGHLRLRRKPKASLPTAEKRDAAAPTDRAKAKAPPPLSSSDRRAKQSALLLRSLIVGSDTDEGDLASPQGRVSGVQMKAVKAQLLKPKTAGKLIAQLKALPALPDSASRASQPIQAVCLPYTDEEADEKHLSRLRSAKEPPPAQSPPPPTTTTTTTAVHTLPSASAAIESFAEAIRNLHIVSLFTAPDLGLGQPGDSPGLLAGAVPTAETVMSGITQITPQLMALAYATGKTIVPDHNGVYPPTDRISVLTCTPFVHHCFVDISHVPLCRLVGSGTPPAATNFGIFECEFPCPRFVVVLPQSISDAARPVHLGHSNECPHHLGRHVRGRARNSPFCAVLLAVHRF